MAPQFAVAGRSPGRRLLSVIGWAAICLAGFALRAAEDETPAPAEPAEAAAAQGASGRLIRVPLPITGTVDTQIKTAVKRAIAKLPKNVEQRPILVLEFDAPEKKSSQGSSFERSLSLADYLSGPELSGIKTVAFIPKALKGHAVLAAIACEEIVMAPDAEIGEAGLDEPAERPIGHRIRGGYTEIAEKRRTIPFPIVLGMVDRQVEVLKVETDVSIEYVLRQELDALKEKRTVQNTTVLKRARELGNYTGRSARQLGFVKYLAADRAAVGKALGLPNSAIQQDPSLEGAWRPIRIPLTGELKPHVIARVQRMIEDQIRDGDVNFICFWIDSPGGARPESMLLANQLAALDSSAVRTVAFIPGSASADAAVIALACDEIVMQPDAKIGGGTGNWSDEDLGDVTQTLRGTLTGDKSRSWSLPIALLDGRVSVFTYTNKNNGLVEHFTEEEADALKDEAWQKGDEITEKGKPLVLTGTRAEELGIARHLVDDFSALRERYGLENDLALVEPGWADFLIDALAAPGVAWLLLFVGGAALYAELQSPGIGIGAFVAGICFLLFFWSRHLNGTAGWLEALLFIAGVVCVLLEIFVLPGTAVFGLGGGLLILISLILASQTFVFPHTKYEVGQLRDSMLGLVGVGAAMVFAIAAMRKFLPHSPLFSHMMLEPPSGQELEVLSQREALVQFDHLLGQRGTTTTPLSPAGKARFGDELVDVLSSGDFIPRGSEVQVTEVHGNRIVVRALV